jgi:hypothetical protein
VNQSHFKIVSYQYGGFDGKNEALVTIDRDSNLISVRPKNRHRTYEMRLEDVARIILYNVTKAEIREKKKLKKIRRKGIL